MNKKGQALVEMSIMLILLFLLVFGIFQFGWLMFMKNSLNNAARAGARFAVVTRPQTPPTWTSVDVNPIKQFTSDSVHYVPTPIPISDINVCVNDSLCTTDNSNGSTPSSGDTITIRVTLNSVTKFAPKLIIVSDTLTGQASMRYE